MAPDQRRRAQRHASSDGRSRRSPGRLVAVVIALAVSTGLAAGPVFAQAETPAERAAQEIQAARDRANAAATAYFEAESLLDSLEQSLIGLASEEVVLQGRVDRLLQEVQKVALSRFVTSGTTGIPLLTEIDEPQDQVQAAVFVDVLTNNGADVVDRFEAAERLLVEKQDEIDRRTAEVESQREEHARLRDEANAEVVRLRAIEEERLQDEAVQKALEAQLAKELARIEEQARLEAEAAARARPNPGIEIPVTTVAPTTTLPPAAPDEGAGETAPADGVVDPAAADDGATATGTAPVPTDAPVDTAPEPTLPPASTLPENTGASGGASGGRTGATGAGSTPRAPVGNVISGGGTYIENIVCPMPGSAYADTWGAPRSGGRRHEGVDMIAPRGVPIYAVTNGRVTFKSNRLGGNAVSLVGDNGTRYYYGHLDSYVGASGRRVLAGDLIGYNGDTGNAKFSTPHLHFEIHPGGGLAVNPTATVRAAGC